MGKLPYITDCELFVRLDFKHAEELLAEYNDFYIFNMAQYNHIYHRVDENFETEKLDEIDEQKRAEIADRNAKVATDYFMSLFGSKDFSESAMVGFRPAWYDLQQILLEEYKHKTPIQDSAMNGIAPILRNIASIMLFATNMIEGFENFGITTEQTEVIKDGFRMLMERATKEKVEIPEYNKSKMAIRKFKKPEQYIDFCEKLFLGRK